MIDKYRHAWFEEVSSAPVSLVWRVYQHLIILEKVCRLYLNFTTDSIQMSG